MNKPPCINCITFSMCKGQMQPYLQHDRKEISFGFLQTIQKKCILIDRYVTEEFKRKCDNKRISLITYIADLMIATFKDPT